MRILPEIDGSKPVKRTGDNGTNKGAIDHIPVLDAMEENSALILKIPGIKITTGPLKGWVGLSDLIYEIIQIPPMPGL
ncbi:unnamed protein product [marine sediment metagenome]|uniref:Uncharacterized protein n=1 Tax=marine sediment metagenome TaxID=412755 RepID=X0YY53_9ZZZZ